MLLNLTHIVRKDSMLLSLVGQAQRRGAYAAWEDAEERLARELPTVDKME